MSLCARVYLGCTERLLLRRTRRPSSCRPVVIQRKKSRKKQSLLLSFFFFSCFGIPSLQRQEVSLFLSAFFSLCLSVLSHYLSQQPRQEEAQPAVPLFFFLEIKGGLAAGHASPMVCTRIDTIWLALCISRHLRPQVCLLWFCAIRKVLQSERSGHASRQRKS